MANAPPLVYVAALAVAGHWLLKPEGETLVPVLIHFIPLLLLELNRVRLDRARRARRAAAAEGPPEPLSRV